MDKHNHGVNTEITDPQDTAFSIEALLKYTLNKLNTTLPGGKKPDRVPHKELLGLLLNEIQPIDFILKVRPDLKKIKEEYNNILAASASKNEELYQKLNEPISVVCNTRLEELETILKYMQKKIKQKHYVVCIINELLKVAADSRWNLCKCYDNVYMYNGAYWKQLTRDDLKYFLGKAAVKFGYSEIEAAHHLFKEELLKQFITQAHLPAPENDPSLILINLQNGTFEFTENKWRLRAFNPADFLTYQLPFDYDPNATCEKFNNYQQKVLPDESSRLILQEFSGFIFSKLNLEKCLVLTGGGSNGKSVFFNILLALVGNENALTYSMALFSSEYNRAKLTDVILNYSSEKGNDLDVDTFKALISGEPLQARHPYGKPFTINNKVKFIINCNELPKVTESSEAYFRRFLIIPFNVRILESERDINLADDIIKTELPGVFNWLLAGLERLLNHQQFTESEKANGAGAEFRKQADNVGLFIEDFRYKPSKIEKKLLADLYRQYKTFCQDDNYKALGKNNFSKRLESKGFEATRCNDGSTAFFIEVAI